MRRMAILVAALLHALPLAAHRAVAQSERAGAESDAAAGASDNFNAGSFENSIWQLCQAEERLLRFDRIAPVEGDYSLTIGVDALRKGDAEAVANAIRKDIRQGMDQIRQAQSDESTPPKLIDKK